MKLIFNRRFAALCILFLLLGTTILEFYSVYGVGWDFVAHYLSAKAVISGNFLENVRNAAITGKTYMNLGIIETKNIYFESYRAPLSIAVFAVLEPIFGSYAIVIYLIIMIFLLFYATIYFSRSFKISYVVAGSLIVLPYIVIFPFLVNSEEMLSLSLMIIALSLEFNGKWQSGILFGLACLSKYTTLIFLPVLFLLGNKKKILYSYIAFGVVTLPWLVFNYIVFGNPVYSYLSSIRVSLESSLPSAVSLTAFFYIIACFIPVIFLITIFTCITLKKRRSNGIIKKLKMNVERNKKSYALLGLFLILSILEFIILGLHEDVFDQARYGYFLYVSIGFLLAITTTQIIVWNKKNSGRLFVFFSKMESYLFLFSAICMIILLVVVSSGHFLNNIGSNSVVFTQSVYAMKELGIANCSVISNDWVYLRYYNIAAFSPYDYAEMINKYPHIAIYGIGTALNVIQKYANGVNYTYENFSVYLPENYNCK